jgi:hypothetical protein
MNITKKACIFFKNVYPIMIIILAIISILLLGYLGIHRFNDHWFSQYENNRQPGLVGPVIRFLKQLSAMLLFTAVISLLVGVLSVFRALLGKWTAIKVFIIYENQYGAIAGKLKTKLKSRWINPTFLPFEPMDHDALIQQVQRLIRTADLIIALPGMERSFIDAEIFTASILKKPIIYVKTSKEQKTPDTSYRGYPVFDLEALQHYNYRPLVSFILYIGNASIDLIKSIFRTFSRFYKQRGLFVLATFGICDFLARLAEQLIAFFVNPTWEEKITFFIYWGFTGIAVLVFLIVYAQVILERLRAKRIARQTIRTGDVTLELLSKGLSARSEDTTILECIVAESLPVRHA